jgi:hypothetical protein
MDTPPASHRPRAQRRPPPATNVELHLQPIHAEARSIPTALEVLDTYRAREALQPRPIDVPKRILAISAAACVFRRIWAFVPAVIWALIPEDLGTESERSDGVRSGSERSTRRSVLAILSTGLDSRQPSNFWKGLVLSFCSNTSIAGNSDYGDGAHEISAFLL